MGDRIRDDAGRFRVPQPLGQMVRCPVCGDYGMRQGPAHDSPPGVTGEIWHAGRDTPGGSWFVTDFCQLRGATDGE